MSESDAGVSHDITLAAGRQVGIQGQFKRRLEWRVLPTTRMQLQQAPCAGVSACCELPAWGPSMPEDDRPASPIPACLQAYLVCIEGSMTVSTNDTGD